MKKTKIKNQLVQKIFATTIIIGLIGTGLSAIGIFRTINELNFILLEDEDPIIYNPLEPFIPPSFVETNPSTITTPSFTETPTPDPTRTDITVCTPIEILQYTISQNVFLEYSIRFDPNENILKNVTLFFSVSKKLIIDQNDFMVKIFCENIGVDEYKGLIDWWNFPKGLLIDINLMVRFEAYVHDIFIDTYLGIFEKQGGFELPENITLPTDTIITNNYEVKPMPSNTLIVVGLLIAFCGFSISIVIHLKRKRDDHK